MLRFVPLALASVFPAGCTDAGTAQVHGESPTSASQADGAQPGGGAVLLSGRRGAVDISENNDVYTFEYSYPEEAGNIPGLRALLDSRIKTVREAHIAMAIDARADADAHKYPFNPYAYTTKWQVVADLPGWLSLSAEHWEFTGGAHGNTTFDTLLWDKRAQRARAPLSLFVSEAALQAAVQRDLCDLLDKQRAEKRGEPVVRNQEDWMSACIGLDSTTVLLGSSNRRTFDRIGFLIPPYNAGPYVEGSYEVTLPVNQAIMQAVKPEFQSAFSAVR